MFVNVMGGLGSSRFGLRRRGDDGYDWTLGRVDNGWGKDLSSFSLLD